MLMFIKKIICTCLILGISLNAYSAKTFDRKLVNQLKRASSWDSRKQKQSEAEVVLAGILFVQVAAILINPARAQDYAQVSPSPSLSTNQMNRGFNNFSNLVTEISQDALNGLNHITSSTTQALAEIICPLSNRACLSVDAQLDQVICKGTKEEVEFCSKAVNDFEVIRQTLIPVSEEHEKTQVADSHSTFNFDELVTSLGLSRDEIENAQLIQCENGSKACDVFPNISAPFVALRYSGALNRHIADLVVNTLKEESEFFSYLTQTNTNAITIQSDYLFIHYGIFKDFLGYIEGKTRYNSACNQHSVSFKLSTLLKRLIASSSGNIALKYDPILEKFVLYTINLQDKSDTRQIESNTAQLEIFLDKSGSMQGLPISSINRHMPNLLKKIQETLPSGQKVTVTIYELNHECHQKQQMLITEDASLPAWEQIRSSGTTDLTQIGPFLERKGTDYKIVILFTDGQNNVGNLTKHIESLKKLQASGQFARPFLCNIGGGDKKYFQSINEIFSGSFLEVESMEDCINQMMKQLKDLLSPKKSLIFTIDEQNQVVVWSENTDGIHSTKTVIDRPTTLMIDGRKLVIKRAELINI